jgi:hypothetical protein
MKLTNTFGRVAAAAACWWLATPGMAERFLDPVVDPFAEVASSHEIIEVRVTMQAVVVPLAVLSGWLGGPLLSDAELHTKALEVAATPAGRIVDTQMLVTESGGRGKLEACKEMIYPCEYDPPTFTGEALAELHGQQQATRPRVARPQEMFVAWETRNVGGLLDVGPVLDRKGTRVEMLLDVEWVELLGMEKWVSFKDPWGGGVVQRPSFFSRKISTSLVVKPGSFQLVSMHAPSPREGAAAGEKVLVFIRADILSSPLP